jgi:hypothetical protein
MLRDVPPNIGGLRKFGNFLGNLREQDPNPYFFDVESGPQSKEDSVFLDVDGVSLLSSTRDDYSAPSLSGEPTHDKTECHSAMYSV